MQDRGTDLFRKAVEKLRTVRSWERISPLKRAELISRYLRSIFDARRDRPK